MKPSIQETNEIREKLKFTHIMIFGLDSDNNEYICTHGETAVHGAEISEFSNKIKDILKWPNHLKNKKPAERICSNCEMWQRDEHRPGDIISNNFTGSCMNNPTPIHRKEKDVACSKIRYKF